MNALPAPLPGQAEGPEPGPFGGPNETLQGILLTLAHELRNPLAPIVTAAAALRRDDLAPAEVRRIGALIERQTRHMAALLADLLDVSRINKARLALYRQDLDLHEVLARAIEQTKPLMEARSHRFTLHAFPGAPRVEGDSDRLVQVFANILNNAAKYTPEGGQITLTVEAGEGQVVVRVTDTGIGMSKELLPRVFKVFTQADRPADRHVGGLGLGLWLVKDLVTLHGGIVAASSAGLGLGSEIVVTFPLLENRAARPQASEAGSTTGQFAQDRDHRYACSSPETERAHGPATDRQAHAHHGR